MGLAAAFQWPYVNLFKLCGVEALENVELRGEVEETMVRLALFDLEL